MLRTYKFSKNLEEDKQTAVSKELQLGYLNLSDGFFDEAKANFVVALSLDPKCPDAFWGMMLSKSGIKNEDWLIDEAMKYSNIIYLPECKQAIENADDDLKKIYKQLLEEIYKIKEGDKY